MKFKKATDGNILFSNVTSTNYENFVDVGDDNGTMFFNLLGSRKIPKDINPAFYDMYTPYKGETFQQISYRFYGDIRLWWLICEINNIFDTTHGADGNKPIKIIKSRFISNVLAGIGE